MHIHVHAYAYIIRIYVYSVQVVASYSGLPKLLHVTNIVGGGVVIMGSCEALDKYNHVRATVFSEVGGHRACVPLAESVEPQP